MSWDQYLLLLGRRHSGLFCALGILICWIIVAVPLRAAATRPNVLMIVTDDQGYGDFSLHGNPHVRTPHIDRLGASSVRFDRFFMSSFCAPSRAALLTGRYPERTGVHGVTHNRDAMRPREVTLAEAFSTAGYRSACMGKWHNGEQYPNTALGQGFSEFFGFNAGHWNNYFDATLLRGDREEKTHGYITDVLTDEAMRFIERCTGGADRGQGAATDPGSIETPFFCYLAYNAPHGPIQVPDRYVERFQAQGLDETLAGFYGMCENLDDNVGRLLAFLEERKLAENTLVLLMTDNGGTTGVKAFNAGMRGGKTSVHEGGSRVPLFVRWPAAGWVPHVVTRIASHIDLYPTLLDLCGVPPSGWSPVDGRTLRPLLERVDPEVAWPERTLFLHNPIDETNRYPGAVRTQRHRLVRNIPGSAGGSNAKANDRNAMPWQLYDMEADPGEEHDLASREPVLVNILAEQYEAWLDDVTREGLHRSPLPVGFREAPAAELHAHQAFFSGGLRFNAGPGFANDWLTHWTSTQDKIWFEVEVSEAGVFAVEIAYTCSAEDAGSRLCVTAGPATCEADVTTAPARPIDLPHRNARDRARYQSREWGLLRLGTLQLPKGPVRIELSALSKPGFQVLDFKHLRLIRLDD